MKNRYTLKARCKFVSSTLFASPMGRLNSLLLLSRELFRFPNNLGLRANNFEFEKIDLNLYLKSQFSNTETKNHRFQESKPMLVRPSRDVIRILLLFLECLLEAQY